MEKEGREGGRKGGIHRKGGREEERKGGGRREGVHWKEGRKEGRKERRISRKGGKEDLSEHFFHHREVRLRHAPEGGKGRNASRRSLNSLLLDI